MTCNYDLHIKTPKCLRLSLEIQHSREVGSSDTIQVIDIFARGQVGNAWGQVDVLELVPFKTKQELYEAGLWSKKPKKGEEEDRARTRMRITKHGITKIQLIRPDSPFLGEGLCRPVR